ncbi:MAG: carbamoyltransferase C-terminal domain-containing protein [Desulfuromonadaceae bacterium]
MKVLGMNSPYARPPRVCGDNLHVLNDGGAALIENGKVAFATIEERHTRTRYSGGFNGCLDKAAEQFDLSDIDAIAFSSCCGPKWKVDETATYLKSVLSPDIFSNNPEIVVVGHHESHAAQGFMLSGYKRALVAVLDGFGNLINDSEWSPENWWHGAFERQSYFMAEQNETGRFSLELIGRDAERADEVGVGELYGALTHFCGYDSYQQAGTVMALAAFGKPPNTVTPTITFSEKAAMHCKITNAHNRAAGAFEELLLSSGLNGLQALTRPVDVHDRQHCSIIAQVQRDLEEALKIRLLALADRYQADCLVITGGVALNCLAMGKIAMAFPGKVFVPPAPGDTGQALGNALWASYCPASPVSKLATDTFTMNSAPFWGIPNTAKSLQMAINLAQTVAGMQVIEVKLPAIQAQIAAKALAEGKLVATCLGRSEYGPRALGARSILADPRNRSIVDKVNGFKQREPFRPFAPAILEERVTDYFKAFVDSPFMSFALPFKGEQAERVPAVVHADGTARLQTVAKDSNSPLRLILEEFEKLTGVPVLLNTSFNRKGEPIAETPENALKDIRDSEVMILLDSHVICS